MSHCVLLAEVSDSKSTDQISSQSRQADFWYWDCSLPGSISTRMAPMSDPINSSNSFLHRLSGPSSVLKFKFGSKENLGQSNQTCAILFRRSVFLEFHEQSLDSCLNTFARAAVRQSGLEQVSGYGVYLAADTEGTGRSKACWTDLQREFPKGPDFILPSLYQLISCKNARLLATGRKL